MGWLIYISILSMCPISTFLLENNEHKEILVKLVYINLSFFLLFLQIFSELPFHTFFVAIYCVPVYFLAGFKMDVHNFFMVYAILFLLVYCSRTLAMFAAAWMPTFQLSCFFAQTFFSMYIMSAGFFINLENIFSGKLFVFISKYLHFRSNPLTNL